MRTALLIKTMDIEANPYESAAKRLQKDVPT